MRRLHNLHVAHSITLGGRSDRQMVFEAADRLPSATIVCRFFTRAQKAEEGGGVLIVKTRAERGSDANSLERQERRSISRVD